MRYGLTRPCLAVGLSFGVAQTALACAFHGYTPDPTVVDRLLATEQVVIARYDGVQGYQPVEALMGPQIADLGVMPAPDLKTRLAATPGALMLLARDGAYGPWVELAVLDTRYRGVIDRVMARQSVWALGEETERLAFFAGYLNDPNPDLRRLAFRELDRVSYRSLKAVDLPAVQNLKADLQLGDADLTPIRVLLAGLSEDRGFIPVVSAGLDAAIEEDLAYMGAYATALIELDGVQGVEAVLARYQGADALSPLARLKLLEALAIQHQAADPKTRRAIAKGMRVLLQSDLKLAEAAAGQFGFGSSWRPAQVDKAER